MNHWKWILRIDSALLMLIAIKHKPLRFNKIEQLCQSNKLYYLPAYNRQQVIFTSMVHYIPAEKFEDPATILLKSKI